MSLHLIENLGFVHSATCILRENDMLGIEMHANEFATNLLYAFVENETVRYIGFTEKTFANRLYGYGRPGSDQATNRRVNAYAKTILNGLGELTIYCFTEPEQLQFRGVNINLASGLEINLIKQVAQYNYDHSLGALWNLRGNPYSIRLERVPVAAQVQEMVEENLDYGPVEGLILNHAEPINFQVTLRDTYYNKGFINIRTRYSEHVGLNGAQMTVDLLGNFPRPSLQIPIYRDPTGINKLPRLHMGADYIEWVHLNHELNQHVNVRMINPHHIQLS